MRLKNESPLCISNLCSVLYALSKQIFFVLRFIFIIINKQTVFSLQTICVENKTNGENREIKNKMKQRKSVIKGFSGVFQKQRKHNSNVKMKQRKSVIKGFSGVSVSKTEEA